MLESVLAPNPSALTLDGTRTFIVGEAARVVIDPGSGDGAHLDAVRAAVGEGRVEAVLVTHRHPDHLAGAEDLAERFGCPVRAQYRGNLKDGDVIRTDAGDLVALATPGHTPDHTAFHWPAQAALFAGDLMMGGQDTALVAPPEGHLGPYLASLRRIRTLGLRTIHPAHGPAFRAPEDAIDRYIRHRELRLEQVERALAAGHSDYDALRRAVYGVDLMPDLADAAAAALKAYLEYLQGQGRIRRAGRGWEIAG